MLSKAYEAEHIKARILGVHAQMKLFNFFYGLSLCHLILDNLSRTLQGTNISVAEGQAIASKTIMTTKSFRTDGIYTCFWKKGSGDVKEFDIGEPILPRKRKRPARYEDGVSVPHYSDNPELFYRQLL